MAHSSSYNIFKSIFAIIGIIASLTITYFSIILYQEFHKEDRRDKASNSDVVFVLNQTNLNSNQDFSILHSFESSRPPIINDHIDGYCISLESSHPNADWRKVTELEKPFIESVVFGLNFARQELSCIPSEADIMKGHFLIQSMGFRFTAIDQIDGGEFALLDPSTNSLFYVSFQM